MSSIFFYGLAFDNHQGRVKGIPGLWEYSRKSPSHSSFGGPTSTPWDPGRTFAATPAHFPSCLFSFCLCSANPNFLSNSSPFLFLFAKMCCLQPLKPNYITLIGVLYRKKTFPPRTSQSCSQTYKHYIIRKGMVHTGFPNPIWPGKTSSGNKHNINILKSKFPESSSGCSAQGKESIHQNHSAPLVITPLLLGYPVLWELKGVGWGMKMGPKHLCQQVQPHLQVNKPMWALRLSQKLNTPGWTDHSNLRKEEWQIRPPNRVNQSKHRPGVCVLEKSFLLRVLSPEAHFNL